MDYSKPAMSITELVKETGIKRGWWMQAAHHYLADRYIIRTEGGGKFYFDTAEFEKVRRQVWHQ